MNAQIFLRTAVCLLALAAVGGVLMAYLRLTRLTIPNWIAMAHGFLAAAALTLIVFAAAHYALAPLAWIGLGLLVVAGGAGAFLNLKYQANKIVLPASLIVIHAAMAAIGLVLVWLGSA